MACFFILCGFSYPSVNKLHFHIQGLLKHLPAFSFLDELFSYHYAFLFLICIIFIYTFTLAHLTLYLLSIFGVCIY